VYHSDLSDPDSVRLIFTLQDSLGLCNAQQFVKVLYLFRPRKANLLTMKLDPICIGDTTDTIFVNTSFDTVGYWSCLSCNGSFTDTFSVKTQYVADTLDANQILELLWIAVDPNGVCLPDTAVITVRVDTFSIGQFPTVPIPDICAEDTTIPLQAVAITGVGFWTCPNCNGGFTLPLSGNSKYVSIRADGGDTLLITWNVVNGACDTVRYVDSLYVYKKPEGGLTSTVPLQLCVGVSSSPLPGYLVAGTGSGHWVDPTGMGSFHPDSSQPNAQYRPDTALFSGVDSVYFLTWEIWNGPCDTQRYDLQVDLYKPPYGIFSLANDTLCAGASTGPLGAFVQAPNTGQWYTPNGSGYFTSVTNPNAAYQSAFADSGKTILLAWVIDNAACPPDTLWDSLYVKTSGFGVAFRDTLICSGDTIQLFAFGMNFYSWSPNSATLISNPYVPDPYVFPSDTTIYVVTGRDTFGCEISDTVKVWVKPKLPLVVSNDTTICFGDTVPLFVSGATSVIWSPDTFLTNNTSLSPLAFPSYTITYMVKGLVPNGCWSDEQVTITVKPTPAPIVVANDVCMGYGQLLYTLNDTLCAQKNWFRGDRNAVRSYGPPYDSTHPLFYGSTNTIMPPTDSLGTFTYTVVCVSADGCVGMDDATYTVHPVPVANFYAIYPPTGDTVNTVPYANPTVQFINTSIGAVKFLWDFGDPLSGPFNTDTTASPTHTFVGAGPHTIVLYVENSLGCSDLEVKSNYITVLEQDYYFPNAFSPNGDGVNDRFRPLPADGTARILLFEIYDRWGNKVFETTSNQGWDGNTNDGKPLDPGVYSYKCIIDLDSRGPKVYTGYVTLIR
jgi:gliding motility-associated-like protein